jgi:hypothetical protein
VGFSECLFGAHVGWSTGDGAFAELLIGADCETEVGDEGELGGGFDEDICGFDIAVDDVLLMRRIESSGNACDE